MAGFLDARFIITLVLISAVVFVNGGTDAPNAVATAIASGALKARAAINLSAVCNLFGIIVIYLINDSVSQNIINSVSLGEENKLTALCAAMISIVLFAAVAWYFGIPTSEGHALMAALSGAAAAQGQAGVRIGFWGFVALGIVITTAAGFALGFLLYRLLKKSKISDKLLKAGQVLSAALLSFMHGAQDGQKFAAVLILGGALAGRETGKSFSVLLCGILMAAGTAMGGRRIIEKVGSITEIDQKGGLSCDIAAFISMLVCTLFGIPVSTTHSKTTAVLGVGFSKGTVNLRAWGGMAFAWVLTFPVCFLLSFFITKICV